MSKSPVITIHFDGKPDNTFYMSAGENVTGHVHVQTSKRTQINGIRLEVTGMAETWWEEGFDDNKTYYSGSEKYINMDICLVPSPMDDTEMFLEPSVCKFPFSFILPADLPQSFEGYTGHIRYKAKVVIDRSKKKKRRKKDEDYEATVLFKVIRLLDLNLEPPQLREPLVMHSETPASGFCCCAHGFTEINATLNRGCFVPGETIRIDGEIINRTNAHIKHSKITIYQRKTFWSTYNNENSSHTYSYTTLAKFKRPFLRRGHTDSWNNISFVLPEDIVSSRLDGCRIIDIKYFVEISPIFQGFRRKSELSAVSGEFVIGNIPLRDDFRPSVVTSQPMTSPTCMSGDLSAGYMPPTNASKLGFGTVDGVEVEAWEHDGKDTAEVHAF